MVVVVDAVVSSLITSVSQILVMETDLILNARVQFELFQIELMFISEFLRNSAGNRDRVKEVVKQIHNVALEAEDLIDNFVVNMIKHQRRNTLQKFLHCGERMILLRKVSVEIERINNKINLIFGNGDKYNIMTNNSVVPSTEKLEKALIQRRRRNVEEDGVVGFNNDAELVLKKLDTPDSRRDVVSIIGVGGIGKTTLAKKIYNDSFVKQSFDCCAWVDVSQNYNPRDLLLKIADSVFSSYEMKKTDGMTEAMLVEKLAAGLAEKRYMIVLDDVWDKQLWDGIKAAFPRNRKKSRVLITSRVKDVAWHANVYTPPYFMSLLNEDDSWKLFSTKVFRGQVFPPKLEQLAREQILTRCKGLPLAIVVAAGLLRNREESMWSHVASDLNWYLALAHDPIECLAILAFSYEDLPPHLKPCFLYFGVFPANFDIPVRQLIRLWVAEGFVDQETNNNFDMEDMAFDMEDMAEEYLSQLIDRNLIKVASRRTDGGVKSCRIHDVLRDLTISYGIREKFLVVDKNADSSSSTSNKPIRRLSVHYGSKDIKYNYLSVSKFSRLRSLLSFGNKDNNYRDKLALGKDPFSRLSKICRYLRVLDLGSARYYNFPPKVENLAQLRYLRINALNNPDNLLLPISKLLNLQTLDLSDSHVCEFSANLYEMQHLRHLVLSNRDAVTIVIRKGNGNSALPNLRTLSGLKVYGVYDVGILKMFPNLKKLKINCYCLRLFEYLSKLQRLQTLKIEGVLRFTDPGALPLSLTKLTLSNTRLGRSNFSQLGQLPNLQILKLRNKSLRRTDLKCGSDQGLFPRLEVLHMEDLLIKWWSMKGQGFPSLAYISIKRCYHLKSIPDQLKQLSTLRQLKVRRCHALKKRIKKFWVDDARFEYLKY